MCANTKLFPAAKFHSQRHLEVLLVLHKQSRTQCTEWIANKYVSHSGNSSLKGTKLWNINISWKNISRIASNVCTDYSAVQPILDALPTGNIAAVRVCVHIRVCVACVSVQFICARGNFYPRWTNLRCLRSARWSQNAFCLTQTPR